MTNRPLLVGCLATLSLVAAVAAQTAAPQQPQRPASTAPAPPPASAPARAPAAAGQPAAATSQPVKTAAEERAMLDRYCVSCHNERAKASGMDSSRKLQLDTLDPANVLKDGAKWELVVRKL